MVEGRDDLLGREQPLAMLVNLLELGAQAREDVVSPSHAHDLSTEHRVQLADLR